MEFELDKSGDVAIVRIKEKKLTSMEAPDMKTTILGLIIERGGKILVNLSEVLSMDSTGLGAFLFGVRQADRHATDMRFCCAGEKIQYLIRIAHLESVIDIYPSENDALKAFADGS